MGTLRDKKKKWREWSQQLFRTNGNLSFNLRHLIGLFFKLGFEILKPRFEVQTRV